NYRKCYADPHLKSPRKTENTICLY
ncbi:hypothetical protein CP061683_1135B, partial [Chlamydia psittaci 06-1683]